MDVLFKNVKFYAPDSPYHLKNPKPLVHNGKISAVGKEAGEAETVVEADGPLGFGGLV